MSQRTRSSLKSSSLFNPDTMALLMESSRRERKEKEIEKQNEKQKEAAKKPKKPLVKLGKCAKCSVIGAIIVAVVLMIMSLFLFIFGFVLKVNTDYDRFKTLTLIDPAVTPSTAIQKMSFYYSYSPLDIIAIFATFFGGSLCLISIGAIVGACLKHKCLLGALIAYIIIILVLSFAGLFFTMSYANDEMTRLVNSVIATAVSGYGKVAAVTESLNYVQYYMNCCGVQTNKDIYTTGNFSSACCSSTTIAQDTTWFSNVITIKIPTVTFNGCTQTTKSPCYTVLVAWMQPLVIALVVVYFIFEIVLLLFLIFIFQALKAKNRVDPKQVGPAPSVKNRERTEMMRRRAASRVSVMSRRQSQAVV